MQQDAVASGPAGFVGDGRQYSHGVGVSLLYHLIRVLPERSRYRPYNSMTCDNGIALALQRSNKR